jgi:DNA-binding MarR family transcriptional regulator
MALEDKEIERLLGRRPRITVEEIVRHPRFAEARRLYLDRFLKIYGDDPFLARLLIETGRFMVCHLAFVLEAAHDPARRETWPTVGLLKQTLASSGLATGRHVDDLIGRLCAVGYLELRRSDDDRRVRLLSTTEKMRAHDRDWLVAHYAPLTVLCPEQDYGRIMGRDPQFQVLQRRLCMSFKELGLKLLMAAPDMILFLNRAGGYMVIAALLRAAMEDPDHPHAAVPYEDAGDRFGVSRTQVRKLMDAAEENGLVRLHGRGGHRVELLPRLWSSHDLGIACGMCFHDIVYLAAERAAVADRAGTAAA